jgi:uncharacterized protein (DUF305 family)
MIPHHRSGVEMARIADSKGVHATTKTLAASIVSSQNGEIREIRQAVARFKAAGVKETSLGVPEHATGMSDDGSRLETARPFDRDFIDMMIPHHQGAIRMAHVELDKGKDPEMGRLAKSVVGRPDSRDRRDEPLAGRLVWRHLTSWGRAGREHGHAPRRVSGLARQRMP